MPKIQQVKPLGDAGKLDEADALLDEILAWFAQTPCGDGDKTALPDDPVNTEWSHDQVVTIKGYSGDAMEPFISRDGAYLFFNDDKIADKEKDMFWSRARCRCRRPRGWRLWPHRPVGRDGSGRAGRRLTI